MSEAQQIIELAGPYFSYIGGPMLLFCSLAFADLMVDFVVSVIKQTQTKRKKYRA